MRRPKAFYGLGISKAAAKALRQDTARFLRRMDRQTLRVRRPGRGKKKRLTRTPPL